MTEDKVGFKKPCTQCGAELRYEAGTEHLLCPYCNHSETIDTGGKTIAELDIETYLNEMGSLSHSEEIAILHCKNCGAPQHIEEKFQSLQCVYCSNPLLIEDTVSEKWILPGAVLPFQLEKERSDMIFEDWVKGLWFAPNILKKTALNSQTTKGLYLPYWTFDAQLLAQYSGSRGTHYYVTEHYPTVVNGKSVRRSRQVQKTRWRSVSGSVSGFVDDTLINASSKHRGTIPRPVANWDLKMLKPFDQGYLSGYITEKYTVPLIDGNRESHTKAREIADGWARSDIGGDAQRVYDIDMKLTEETFKHILVPVYLSTYKYKDKVYRFFINGQSGTSSGARPYSFWKIFFLVIFILLIVGGIVLLQELDVQLPQ